LDISSVRSRRRRRRRRRRNRCSGAAGAHIATQHLVLRRYRLALMSG
jgi:hypothetical protein